MAFDLSMLDIEPQFNEECNCGSGHHATMVALGERLDSAMKARGVTVSRLAKAVDMSYQGIKKIVNGKTQEMDASNCIKIAGFLGINAEWLRTGEGQRDLGSASPAERAVSESQWALLEDFEMLPEDEKQALRSTLRSKADNVRKIVSEYLTRQGVKSPSATDQRVAESFGAPPPPPRSGAAGYQKITPIPSPPSRGSKKKEN
jgi:transcriptional regulator with XRE-family HTH domain